MRLHTLQLPSLDVTVLEIAGEIDLSTVGRFAEALNGLATDGMCHVIIDAGGVTFIDSTGLHALLEGKKLLHDAGCDLILVASRQVRRLLDLVFPEPLFARRVDTMGEALALLDGHQ